ncbi:6663_t:CDS:2 [Diversispora eburnea]|uniref:6663_t:CDS:1 n=1 Tax=Diversispora eburnea TaxID=1213867 RepID=A0A9N8Z2W6_9GLOM|nr:6663_t:CDS:2 [Diversispora eburnea]
MEVFKLLNPIEVFNKREISLLNLEFFDLTKDKLFAHLVIELRIREIWGFKKICFYDFEKDFNSIEEENKKIEFIQNNLKNFFPENHERKDLAKLEKIKFSLFLNKNFGHWKPDKNNKNELTNYNRKKIQLEKIKVLHNLLGFYLPFFPILWKSSFNTLVEHMKMKITNSVAENLSTYPTYPPDIENLISTHQNAFKIFDKNVDFKYIAAMIVKLRENKFWGFEKISCEDIVSNYNNMDDAQKNLFIQNSTKEYFSKGSKETTVNFDKLGKLKFCLFLHDQRENLKKENMSKNEKRNFDISKKVYNLNEYLGEYLRIFPVPFHHMDDFSAIRRTQFDDFIKVISQRQ